MSKHGKRDILIHFDEEKNTIILYTVSVKDTDSIRAREFDGAQLDIPFFMGMAPEEAERTLGETVFSLVDTFSFKKTGIRSYEALNEDRHRQDVANWEVEAGNGDAEAQYMMFIEYHSRALFGGDAEALDRAERMLEASVSQGYASALVSKEHWPLMRAAAERKLKGGPAA